MVVKIKCAEFIKHFDKFLYECKIFIIRLLKVFPKKN